MRSLASFLFVACNHSSPINVDASTDAPDASTSPPAMLVQRGVAGMEDLYFIDGDTELRLSAPGGEPLCDGKVFCDFPPNPVATRFPFFDFLDADHAIMLDAAGPTIESVSLTTGERTLLSGSIAWAPVTETRAGWIYSFARAGAETYWSLATQTGYELFRSKGPGQALESIARVPFVAGEAPRQSRLIVDGNAVAWSIGTVTGTGSSSEWSDKAFLLDRDGKERFGPSDLPAGAGLCSDRMLLAGPSFVVGAYPASSSCGESITTIVVDVATGAQQTLIKNVASFPIGLSRDGSAIYEQMLISANASLITFSAGTGKQVTTTPGWLATQSQDWLLLKGNQGVASWLELYDVADASRSFTIQAPGQVGLGDTPYGDPRDVLVTSDGSVVAVTGDRSPDLCTNVGLSIFTKASAPRELEAPACSDALVRQPRVHGDWLIYLRDEGGPHVVAYNMVSAERRRLTSTTATERGFVLAP